MEKFWEGKYECEQSLNVCYVVYESQFKRLVQLFGKQSDWFCCLELDEMIDTISVLMWSRPVKLQRAAC